MNWADWVLVGIIVISILIGLKRGFVKEALSVAVWIVAFFVAFLLHEKLAMLLESSIDTYSLRQAAAMAILFFSTLIVGAMVNHLMSALVKATGLSGTDRLLGMVFGLARGGVVAMALLIFIPSAIPVKQDAWWQQSLLIPKFMAMEELSNKITQKASSTLKELIEKTKEQSKEIKG